MQKSAAASIADTSFNLRGKLWKILCKLDVLIDEMLAEYNHNIDKVGPAFKSSTVENKKAYKARPSQRASSSDMSQDLPSTLSVRISSQLLS